MKKTLIVAQIICAVLAITSCNDDALQKQEGSSSQETSSNGRFPTDTSSYDTIRTVDIIKATVPKKIIAGKEFQIYVKLKFKDKCGKFDYASIDTVGTTYYVTAYDSYHGPSCKGSHVQMERLSLKINAPGTYPIIFTGSPSIIDTLFVKKGLFK